jgi:hypothetical protein
MRSGRPSLPLRRMFIVVVPAQIVGILLCGQLLTLSGALQHTPDVSVLIACGAGASAGLALGLLVTPVPQRRRSYVIVSAVFGLASYLLLSWAARLAVVETTARRGWLTYVWGSGWVVATQTLVAWGLWALRKGLS